MAKTVPHAHVTAGSGELGTSLRAAFLIMAGLILVVFFTEDWLKTFSLVFVSIILEAFPFMLIGSMVSGVVEVFVSKDRLASILPRRKSVLVFLSAGLGVLFPVCECAIVPVVRRFLRKGVPFSAAVAYLLAGPLFNPVVGASTAVAYASQPGNQTLIVVGIRLGTGFLVAVGIGLIMGRLFPGSSALIDDAERGGKTCACGGKPGHAVDHDHGAESDSGACGCGADHGHDHDHDHTPAGPPRMGTRVLHSLNHGVDDFLDVTQYLVIGAFVAALLQTLVSRETFVEAAGTPFVALPLMMGLAFVLNLCSEADAFIAASFRGVLPLSAQMAFMVLGPMLDIKLVVMYLGVFRKRTIVILAVSVFLAVLAASTAWHLIMAPWFSAVPGLQ